MAAFAEGEIRQMNAVGLKHAPTIGAMYEGLTAKLLRMSVPIQLNLRVVSGFIEGPTGDLSPQVDCMLVRGEGRSIPHTADHIWPIQDVLVVLEVKKTLYGAEFRDAYEKLRVPVNQYLDLLRSDASSHTTSLAHACKVYARMTGECAPTPSQLSALPYEKKMILTTLALEQVSPVRIALGYDGFRSEAALRQSVKSFLKANIGKPGYGVHSFPQLSVSGQYALLKLNGFPFQSLVTNGRWTFLASCRCRPIELMLEFIWTRLHRDHPQLGDLCGDDLELEALHPCVEATAFRSAELVGWQMETVDLTGIDLEACGSRRDWEPNFVNELQFLAFNMMCRNEPVIISGAFITDLSRRAGGTVDEFVSELVATGLVARRNDSIELTTEECGCVVLPDGRLAVAENNSGRLTRWIAKHYGA